MALETLHGQTKSVRLKISWDKTKVGCSWCLESCRMKHCSLFMRIRRTLIPWKYSHTLEKWCRTTPGLVKKSYGGLAVLWTRSARVCGVVDIVQKIFKPLVLPALPYCCETWILNSDLMRWIDVFGNIFLRRIMHGMSLERLPNQQLPRATNLRLITRIVREHHLRIYGHVARHLEVDPAH